MKLFQIVFRGASREIRSVLRLSVLMNKALMMQASQLY
ncbi:protein of unknown function [Magnetospirillum sp. XM-1]|nr:protein of unknown function [Magnetospirillum sp. XM-1]